MLGSARPAFLACQVEDDVLAVVLGCLCLCMLSEAADRFLCPLSAVHACLTVVPLRPTPSATGRDLREGTTSPQG